MAGMLDQEQGGARAPVRPRGRPRLEDAEERILRTALTVYGERGWHDTTMQAIARHAGVSKGLIYSRWPDVEQIIEAAFEGVGGYDESFDALPIRDFLVAECRSSAEMYLGARGLAIQRLIIEGQVGPETLRRTLSALNARRARPLRHRVRRAVAEGELPESTDVGQLVDVIEGAIFVHVTLTPVDRRGELVAQLDEYVERLVDRELRLAATWEPVPEEDPPRVARRH